MCIRLERFSEFSRSAKWLVLKSCGPVRENFWYTQIPPTPPVASPPPPQKIVKIGNFDFQIIFRYEGAKFELYKVLERIREFNYEHFEPKHAKIGLADHELHSNKGGRVKDCLININTKNNQ